MVGCVTKSFVFKGKEFTSQHQTQHTESFPLKIKNIERYLQSKLKVSRFDYKYETFKSDEKWFSVQTLVSS